MDNPKLRFEFDKDSPVCMVDDRYLIGFDDGGCIYDTKATIGRDSVKYYPDYVLDIFYNFRNSGVFDLFKEKLSFGQYSELLIGLANGLSAAQIKVYANKSFNRAKMEAIRMGFEDGLPLESILVYAIPEFASKQMHEIRLGFVSGLSMNEVEIYATNKFTTAQMREIRWGLQHGLSVKDVSQYAKLSVSAEDMAKCRLRFEVDKGVKPPLETSISIAESLKGTSLKFGLNKCEVDR